MQEKARPSRLPHITKVPLTERTAPVSVTCGQEGVGPLGHLQVDLGRLLVCLPGLGQIGSISRMMWKAPDGTPATAPGAAMGSHLPN